ncbi:hypothetical protein IscW_ISCW008282, partial [Ixodes scapularis]
SFVPNSGRKPVAIVQRLTGNSSTGSRTICSQWPVTCKTDCGFVFCSVFSWLHETVGFLATCSTVAVFQSRGKTSVVRQVFAGPSQVLSQLAYPRCLYLNLFENSKDMSRHTVKHKCANQR